METMVVSVSDEVSQSKTDVENSRFPYSIVWTPIHPITWAAPFVGHMGICGSRGVIHDWMGGPIDGRGEMGFGRPTRYVRLDPRAARCCDAAAPEAELRRAWDAKLDGACALYGSRLHCMLFGFDCHSHVATTLDALRYRGCCCWNKIVLAAWVFFCGRHVSWSAAAQTWAGSIVLYLVVLLVHFK